MDSHKFTSLTHTQHSWVKRTMVFYFIIYFLYLLDTYYPLTDLVVTNLGGELVWYTLILIYSLCCVSFGFVTIYIHHVLFLYLMMMYVFHSLSHMCCFFSLYTHVSCLFNLSLFFTWYLDVFCLVPFRKDKLKPSQVPNLLLAATSKV